MGKSIIKNSRKLHAGPSVDPSLDNRVYILENNEYKITYYEIISGTSGSLTIPSQATINADEFGLSGNCILSKIDGSNKPTFESPTTSGGTTVTASLNITNGAWTASGAYTDPFIVLIYSIQINAQYYSNLVYSRIVETVALVPVGSGGALTLQNVVSNDPTISYLLAQTNSALGKIKLDESPGLDGGVGLIYIDSATGKIITNNTFSAVRHTILVYLDAPLTEVTGDLQVYGSIQSPDTLSYLNLSDTDVILEHNGTHTGGVDANDTHTNIYHDLKIDLNAPSVQKNGVEVATVNDILPTTLTGYASTTGTITSSDTILTAIEKLNGNIGAISGGGITRSVLTGQSGSVTAGATANKDYVYIFTASGTLTLPTAVGNTNRYTVKNRHSSTITIAFTGGQNADGSTTLTLQPYTSLDLISDNANYNVI